MNRLLALLAIGGASAASAAPFTDPTRPPSQVAGEAAVTAPAGPRLESVLIAPDRRIAVVSGQQVTIGTALGGGHVIGITESEVRIRKPDGEESLTLFPAQARRRPAAGKGD